MTIDFCVEFVIIFGALKRSTQGLAYWLRGLPPNTTHICARLSEFIACEVPNLTEPLNQEKAALEEQQLSEKLDQ